MHGDPSALPEGWSAAGCWGVGAQARGKPPSMTERKPSGVSFESWVERQLREARDRGSFDDLPGAGKPLPRTPSDELAWVREKARRENLPVSVLLPPALAGVAKEVEDLPGRLARERSEARVRSMVKDLNIRDRRCPSRPAGRAARADGAGRRRGGRRGVAGGRGSAAGPGTSADASHGQRATQPLDPAMEGTACATALTPLPSLLPGKPRLRPAGTPQTAPLAVAVAAAAALSQLCAHTQAPSTKTQLNDHERRTPTTSRESGPETG